MSPSPRARDNPSNPSIAVRRDIAFTDGRRSREESFNCVDSLVRVMTSNGRRLGRDGDVVADDSTGLSFRPLLASFQPIHPKGVQTVTSIEVTHATLFPRPTFEFQHSTGTTTTESIEAGIDQWCKADLVALADATRERPRDCTMMLMTFPAADGRPARKRRLILGPIAHLWQHQPPPG